MASKLAQSCCNISYDFLTICISIADVVTDIIVLIDFYNKGRMVFFAISLAILILAQCSYSIAFALRFNTMDNWKAWKSSLAFFCCLPFGTIVAFILYFAGEESECGCFNDFITDNLHLDADNWFTPSNEDSNMVKFIKRKLDRHLGFLLEAAIEAFPQSLLQIVAIVYYQEANVISIISILLSMFSVMSKSFILSQGAEKYTFIWTWLCVVTDFFGIFFTFSWVFYSNDAIHGEYYGYFNVFGLIWIWKFAISILFPISLFLIIFFGFVYWFFGFLIMYDPESDDGCCKKCFMSLLWFIFS